MVRKRPSAAASDTTNELELSRPQIESSPTFPNLPLRANMSWYYCNLIDDQLSAFVPAVQAPQNASEVTTKAQAVRSATSLALGAEIDDELAVGRSTYVLAASFAAAPMAKTVGKSEANDEVVVEKTEPVTPEIKAPEVSVSTEPAAAETGNNVVIESVPEHDEPVSVEKIEGEVIDPVASEDITQEDIADAVVEEETVVEAVAVEEETAVGAALEEAVAVVETVVETVAVVEEEAIEPVVAQAAAEEESVVEETEPVAEPVAETPASPTLTSDAVSDEKLVDKAEDVMLDMIAEPRKLVTRMPSIPEDDQSVDGVEDELPVEESDNVEEIAGVDEKESEESVESTSAAAKPVADDASDTQSEISEAPAIEAVEPKIVEEPESEIDETMVIDPDVAAKEAAVAEAQASSFSFIPESLRQNSYAVSSVAVAVATAIAATLVARR